MDGDVRRPAAVAVVTAALAAGCGSDRSGTLPDASADHLPRWRGFNLLEKFNATGDPAEHTRYREADFRTMAGWGFNFARLPMDYRIWTEAGDLHALKEAELRDIDRAVTWGARHGVHVCLCFHRAPGFCINRDPPEALDLWRDEAAQRAFAWQWGQFAKRYRGIPGRRLSFNLVNEPTNVTEPVYAKVVRRAVAAIRAEDPARLVIVDGLDAGMKPVPNLADLGVAQSFHAYAPYELSCYKAEWFWGADRWPVPSWPMTIRGERWDRTRLKREFIEPWKALERLGVGVHAGEAGCYRFTPRAAALAWTKDWLELLEEAGWGWAMWNLRGPIGGPLDSDRSDLAYEAWRGHKLDRALLELLRTH